ncbi:DUF4962 domain-containing protein [Kiritimatiellota bacterium B12222]|nr:DUF4962 domain-containing protein [Kiritimatiellota bacterium B12222]
MKPQLYSVIIALCLSMLCPGFSQSPPTSSSRSKTWQFTGEVSQNSQRDAGNGGGSFQIGPGGKAVLMLRNHDDEGSISFSVYEDGSSPTTPKKRRGGPHYGILTTTGEIVAVGAIYAPYLSGQNSYASTQYNTDSRKTPWAKVQYLGVKRTKGWHHWTFDFKTQTGLKISVDGKEVERFDSTQVNIKGFAGIVLVGDIGGPDGQTIWVDPLTHSAEAPSKMPPSAPSARPSILPPQDPSPTGHLTSLNHPRLSAHPRLLFGAEDIESLKANAQTPMGKIFMRNLEAYLSTPPQGPAFAKNDTDGQRHGLWRMPTLGLHYVLTGNQQSFDHAVAYLQLLVDNDIWQKAPERNSGMGAANVMIGAALVYDWLYQDLDPAFREQVRQTLIHHAREMYYGGHLNRNNIKNAYWQHDPQNNHRWHRNAGLTLCAIAAYQGSDQETWLLEIVQEQLAYVIQWRPDDGSYSEGPGYMIFGGLHLMLAMTAADRNLGTDFLSSPFIRNNGKFIAQSLVPSRQHSFMFNDMGKGEGLAGYANYLYKIADLSDDGTLQYLLDESWRSKAPKSVHVAWVPLIWYNPLITEQPPETFPTRSLFPSAGVAFIRDGWTEHHVGAIFRCMPLGGIKLNEFRNAHKGQYVNIAHDDPDANAFSLWKAGDNLTETDRYSHQKQSSNHNTLLINGMGQAPQGRSPLPTHWMQPGEKEFNMLDMAWFTAWSPSDDVVMIEGEAAGSYGALSAGKGHGARPALSRYRRTFIWVEGRYVLVIDDIRSPLQEVDMTWLMQAPQLTQQDETATQFQLSHDRASIAMQVISQPKLQANIIQSSADHRGKNLGFQQLQLSGHGKKFLIASVYDLWNRGSLSLSVHADGPDQMNIRVTTATQQDQWQWQAATDNHASSTLLGQRNGVPFATLTPEKAFPENE